MSYNINKLNTNAPTDESFSALDLASLITVSNPADGEFLAKASTNWDTTTLTAQQVKPIYAIDPFGSYNVGIYWYGQNDNYIVYKSKEVVRDTVTYLNASGSYVPVANNNWFQSLFFSGAAFNGKTVIFEASVAPFAYTTMRAEVQWVNGYTNTYTPIGPPSKIHGQGHADTIYGRFVGTGSNVYISLKFRYLSSTTAAWLSGGVRHQAESIIIRVYD